MPPARNSKTEAATARNLLRTCSVVLCAISITSYIPLADTYQLHFFYRDNCDLPCLSTTIFVSVFVSFSEIFTTNYCTLTVLKCSLTLNELTCQTGTLSARSLSNDYIFFDKRNIVRLEFCQTGVTHKSFSGKKFQTPNLPEVRTFLRTASKDYW